MINNLCTCLAGCLAGAAYSTGVKMVAGMLSIVFFIGFPMDLVKPKPQMWMGVSLVHGVFPIWGFPTTPKTKHI